MGDIAEFRDFGSIEERGVVLRWGDGVGKLVSFWRKKIFLFVNDREGDFL